ncbi:MAG: hypothetical protein LE180_05820, partial [Endomicrobium sp.]|uniref:hypothetical protein n=1 Tax=Candidatus Endomicrobiellum pyrsonymphae TaxID=1408203 RepID=UPI0035866905|nr:hypothetical protein [Endomicrobium sp.]
TIAVLLLLSVVLSSCTEKDKSNDFARITPHIIDSRSLEDVNPLTGSLDNVIRAPSSCNQSEATCFESLQGSFEGGADCKPRDAECIVASVTGDSETSKKCTLSQKTCFGDYSKTSPKNDSIKNSSGKDYRQVALAKIKKASWKSWVETYAPPITSAVVLVACSMFVPPPRQVGGDPPPPWWDKFGRRAYFLSAVGAILGWTMTNYSLDKFNKFQWKWLTTY